MSALNLHQVQTGFGPITVPASQTDYVISDEFSISHEGSLNFRADIIISAITVATGITLKLQHKTVGGSFEDVGVGNLSLTTTGTKGLLLNIQNTSHQAYLPLRKMCRLVITTGAGDSVTITDTIYQRA